MPHGRNIYQIASDIAMATICAYPPYQHELTHWKFALRCCAQYPRIDIPIKESAKHNSNTFPTILLHFYTCSHAVQSM